MSATIFWSMALQWLVILLMLFLTAATMFLAGDASRVLGPEKGAPVFEDSRDQLVAVFEARRVPLVYVIDRDGFVAIRTVANGRLDLEDALDGAGHLQEGERVAMDDGDIVPFRGLEALDGLQPKGGSRWNGSMTG